MSIYDVREEYAKEHCYDLKVYKGYNVYFVNNLSKLHDDNDSILVFKNGNLILASSRYSKIFKNKQDLRDSYLKELKISLFEDDELSYVKDYKDYINKRIFLRDLYVLQIENINIHTECFIEYKDNPEWYFDTVSSCMVKEKDFANKHLRLSINLENASNDKLLSDEDYLKSALEYKLSKIEFTI